MGEEGGTVTKDSTAPLPGSLPSSSSPEKAARSRSAPRKSPRCIEFGLRRAQGPDGGFSASKYSLVGGFDATSNVMAGRILGATLAGTHAHSYIQAHSSLSDARDVSLPDGKGGTVNVLEEALRYRSEVLPRAFDDSSWTQTNDGELAAFASYAMSFPDAFLCLIDTYDTLRSGLRNFVAVSLVLDDLGHAPKGIRLDSGDLAYYSIECERLFRSCAELLGRPFFLDLDIVASNDINEEVLHSLNKEGHSLTVFGIGTNLVTCQAQPALGCVYKLVEVNGIPRMKLSQDLEKVLIPGRKVPYRLFGEAGWPLLDVMVTAEEDANGTGQPREGKRILCRHPFLEQKRAAVTARRVERLHRCAFDGSRGGVAVEVPNLESARDVSFVSFLGEGNAPLRTLAPAHPPVYFVHAGCATLRLSPSFVSPVPLSTPPPPCSYPRSPTALPM